MDAVSADSSRPPAISPLIPVDRARDPGELWREGFSAEEVEAVARCADWTATFPLRRVRKGARVEAICPLVAPAMENETLLFASALCGTSEPPLALLDALLMEAAGRFESEIPSADPRLRCLVLVLPGVRGGRLLEATDPARPVKELLLRRGILAGEFFPACPFSSTFNPRLFALRSPAPMYVLRTFIETDWRFICRVPAWQRAYRERFGEPPAKLREIGGPWWRFKERIRWRLDALARWIRPGEASPE